MITIRKSLDRGHANHGWLDSYHTFSFASYHDPKYMGFSVLRVINEDRINAGAGFATHSHRDMEIISYAISGALEHKDSMGNTTIISPGDVQRMSAGSGVTHSEYNHFKDKQTHFLQIWILPDTQNIEPSYEQKSFLNSLNNDKLTLIASKDGRENSISLHQDILMYVGKFTTDGSCKVTLTKNRKAWVQVIKGSMVLNSDYELDSGDGAAIMDLMDLELSWSKDSEFLFFDLP